MATADKLSILNMRLACPTQFPACLLCKCLVSFVLMACLYVFPACLAEILLTLWLKTERLAILTGSVQVRSVMFPFKYRQFVLTACLEGESCYLMARTARFSRQDSNSIGQDGKCK